jgi:cytochrome bd ubiquinol oxidase subunit I
MAAEVGRQPWAVYGVLRTADAFSSNLSAGVVLASILMFSLIYVCLLALYLYLLVVTVRHGPGASKRERLIRVSEKEFAA